MYLLRITGWILLAGFLTALTQVGGLILLVCFPLFSLVKRKYERKGARKLINFSIFLIVYLSITIFGIPPLAKSFGRVPLPVFSNDSVKPLNILTCFLNRHYVRLELKANIQNVATRMEKKYPETVVSSYLDANFPFYNGFPLLPHLSHNDGKKLDIAFFYKDKHGNQINESAPSFIGYGVFEEPKEGEFDMPKRCNDKGAWQYSLLGKVVSQWNKEEMLFDLERTKYFIQLLIREGSTSKIFVETHLKTKMNLNSNKIRFHGCQAVRHDDHVNLQIK